MKTKIIIVLLTVVTIVSCKKPEKGETGPQGPAGNANVKSYQFNPTSWTYYSSGESYESVLSVPQITNDIISKGTVQLFISYNQVSWIGMPCSITDLEFNYVISNGQAVVSVQNSTMAPISNPGSSFYFKVVVIAGSSKRSITTNQLDKIPTVILQ